MITLLRYLPFLAVLAALAMFLSFDPDRFGQLNTHWGYMLLSGGVLYGMFWFRALTWWWFLGRLGIPISRGRAVTSQFITVLTKYLPGKVWPILSIAAYVESPRHQYRDSLVSVGWYQLAILISGIAVGSIGLLSIADVSPRYFPAPLLLLATVGWLIDRPWFSNFLLRPLAARLGLSLRQAGSHSNRLLAACTAQWLILAVAFWLLFRAVGLDLRLTVTLAQALANVAGILVPFAPAGLGIREAASAGYIATQVTDAGAALMYAAVARAWWFTVELAVFATGLMTRCDE